MTSRTRTVLLIQPPRGAQGPSTFIQLTVSHILRLWCVGKIPFPCSSNYIRGICFNLSPTDPCFHPTPQSIAAVHRHVFPWWGLEVWLQVWIHWCGAQAPLSFPSLSQSVLEWGCCCANWQTSKLLCCGCEITRICWLQCCLHNCTPKLGWYCLHKCSTVFISSSGKVAWRGPSSPRFSPTTS